MNVPPSNVIVLIPVSSIDDTVDINNIVTDSLSVVTELMVRLIVITVHSVEGSIY